MANRETGWTRWWAAAEHAARRAASPPVDVAAVDADVTRIVAASWMASTGARLLAAIGRHWSESRTRATIARFAIDDRPSIAVVVGSASIVALLALAVAPASPGPWSAILPLICAAASLVAFVIE
jgi:hypothetical protein